VGDVVAVTPAADNSAIDHTTESIAVLNWATEVIVSWSPVAVVAAGIDLIQI
jgi:hypothetical protein